MDILDVLTFLSYVAVNVDVLLQIKRIHHTKSSHDLSLVGFTIRYIALVIIFIKFLSLGDIPLMLGQLLLLVTFTTYFWLAITYLKHRKKRRKA